MTPGPKTLRAFEGYGVELEFMLVASDTLDVAPSAPDALRALAGTAAGQPPPNEVTQGQLGWSNELVCHLLELKNPRPAPTLRELAAPMLERVAEANSVLEPLGVRLMPGGMHPWMRPATETVLWPFENAGIYAAYDRIFGCRSHGWANLQSQHLNLPFAGDEEFRRLHAAIRLLLPILPAVAASSPYCEGRASGYLDTRLLAYRTHASAVPSLTGDIVPETTLGIEHYRQEVLEPIYRDIAPWDPEGTLCHEWLNARGVIPRFDRSALEIRVLDVQESPVEDLAIAALVCDAVRYLFEETSAPLAAQQALPTRLLSDLLMDCARYGEQAEVASSAYLKALGDDKADCSASELWMGLGERLEASGAPLRPLWEGMLSRFAADGPLARRLMNSAGRDATKEDLRRTYARMCACLAEGRRFVV